jgi:hypothetical protein
MKTATMVHKAPRAESAVISFKVLAIKEGISRMTPTMTAHNLKVRAPFYFQNV